MTKDQNAAQTIKARSIIALPELLEACLHAGKEALVSYQLFNKRIDALDESFNETAKMLNRLKILETESLKEEALTSLEMANTFIGLADSCREFLESGDYPRYQAKKKKTKSHSARPKVVSIKEYLIKNEEVRHV